MQVASQQMQISFNLQPYNNIIKHSNSNSCN